VYSNGEHPFTAGRIAASKEISVGHRVDGQFEPFLTNATTYSFSFVGNI